MKSKKYCLVLFLCQVIFCFSLGGCASSATKSKAHAAVDLVIFSFDRPMQLFALLESTDHYITGLGDVIVVYRTSNDQFEDVYGRVKEYFPGVVFIKQGNNPHADFKPLTLHAVFDSPHDYILFGVDDIIVKDYIDLAKSIGQMEKYGAYAVYFKLGLHLTYCYTRNHSQRVPPYQELEDDLCCWHFKDGQYDWGYPHTVDMTLYRKKDIAHDLRTLRYKAPNSFEGSWAGRACSVQHKKGLFYRSSKTVNLPINKVQLENNNRHMNVFSLQELLEKFNDGFKIDIIPLFRMKNISVHEEYVPLFVKR